MVSNPVLDLARSLLLSVISVEKMFSIAKEVSVESITKKRTMIDLLSKSLRFLANETLARVQAKPVKGLDLFLS